MHVRRGEGLGNSCFSAPTSIGSLCPLTCTSPNVPQILNSFWTLSAVISSTLCGATSCVQVREHAVAGVVQVVPGLPDPLASTAIPATLSPPCPHLTAWAIFTPLLHRIDEGRGPPVHPYNAGTRGPLQAAELLDRIGFRRNEEYVWSNL